MRERMGWYEGRGEGGKEREHAYEKAQVQQGPARTELVETLIDADNVA